MKEGEDSLQQLIEPQSYACGAGLDGIPENLEKATGWFFNSVKTIYLFFNTFEYVLS